MGGFLCSFFMSPSESTSVFKTLDMGTYKQGQYYKDKFHVGHIDCVKCSRNWCYFVNHGNLAIFFIFLKL